jgi:hypothetical protein
VAAAHDALVWLFPGQQAFLDGKQAESLAAIPNGPAKDAGVAVGRSAAAAVIANRTGDGSAPPQFHTPADDAPYEWQPTPSCASAPANNRGLFLHWPLVKPFGVKSSAQFRAPRPPALASRRYARDLAEVSAVGDTNSTERPPDRADVAKLFAAQPPHRGWNLVARQLASARHDEITKTARTLAVMNMALSDVHITVFESKYFYRTWRPETAIRRADEDGNPRTTANPDYTPFVITPCFPRYPSAHGAGGGAARVVLERAYGRRGHTLTITDAGAPGIELHYSSLRDITDDVSDARVFGGIHFRFDQDAGNEMGEDVGRYDDQHLLRRRITTRRGLRRGRGRRRVRRRRGARRDPRARARRGGPSPRSAAPRARHRAPATPVRYTRWKARSDAASSSHRRASSRSPRAAWATARLTADA